MTKNQKLLIAAILLLVFAASKILLLNWWQKQQPQTQTVACEVQQGCTLPNGAYIKFNGGLDAKQPFDIVLKNVAPEIKEVTVSFAMKDMDMGFNRFVLHRQADGTWLAKQIRLPFCVENRHDYLADIRIGSSVFQTAFTTKP